jgi:hypothetical protein
MTVAPPPLTEIEMGVAADDTVFPNASAMRTTGCVVNSEATTAPTAAVCRMS